MENASKALIIAGAILLSILIIALGIFIFQQAKSAVNMDSLSSTEISTFNASFTQYTGDAILGSSAKTLLENLVSNAATNSGASERLPSVYPYGTGIGTCDAAVGGITAVNDITSYKSYINKIKNKISDSHKYVITYTTNDAGYAAAFTIEYNSGDCTVDITTLVPDV